MNGNISTPFDKNMDADREILFMATIYFGNGNSGSYDCKRKLKTLQIYNWSQPSP